MSYFYCQTYRTCITSILRTSYDYLAQADWTIKS